MTKLVISGSRSIKDRQLVWDILDKYRGKTTELVCGMALHWLWDEDPLAGGVDRFAHDWAVHNDIPITPFIPDWNRGKGAGMMRNADMAAYAVSHKCLPVVIWDGRSTGTEDMCRQLKMRGMITVLHDLSKQDEGLPFE